MPLIDCRPENLPPDPWSKGTLVGPKPALELQHICGIRIRLGIEHSTRELAMVNQAIDSKAQGCDLVRVKVSDAMHGRHAVAGPWLYSARPSSPSASNSQSSHATPSRLGAITQH